MLAAILRGDADGLHALGGPDCAACATLAVHHGLGPCLYLRARRMADAWPLPAEVERELRTSYLGATLENGAFMAGAARAVERLAAAGVPVAALKGLHLASAVYEHPALRRLSDLDLLVPSDRLEAARAALLADGYRPSGVDDPTLHHVAPLVKKGVAPIELHRDICPDPNPFRIDVAPLWERMVPTTVGGQPALGLCAEDLVLHLCVHMVFNHRCLVPLRNVLDVAEVVAGDGVRWDRLEEAARATGTRRAVFCGLALARDMFGAAVPADVLARLAPAGDAAEALRTARENVLDHASAGPMWMGITLAESDPTRRLRGLWGRVFAPPDRLLETSGRRAGVAELAWIYATRPFKLLVRHRHRLAALLRGRAEEAAELRVARAGAALDAWVSAPDP